MIYNVWGVLTLYICNKKWTITEHNFKGGWGGIVKWSPQLLQSESFPINFFSVKCHSLLIYKVNHNINIKG